MGVGRIAPDEERLVLLKPVVRFYFTYGVSRGFLNICLYFKLPVSLFIVKIRFSDACHFKFLRKFTSKIRFQNSHTPIIYGRMKTKSTSINSFYCINFEFFNSHNKTEENLNLIFTF